MTCQSNREIKLTPLPLSISASKKFSARDPSFPAFCLSQIYKALLPLFNFFSRLRFKVCFPLWFVFVDLLVFEKLIRVFYSSSLWWLRWRVKQVWDCTRWSRSSFVASCSVVDLHNWLSSRSIRYRACKLNLFVCDY